MKKLFTMRGYAFACLAFMSTAAAQADAVKVGDLYFNLDTEAKTASVTKSPDNNAEYRQMTSVVIPGSVTVDGETYAVKSIGSQAFLDCNALLDVKIEEGVESIGSWGFGRSLNIKTVSLPSSLTSVSSNAFRRCTSIASLVLPDNLTSIGSSAFRELNSMTSLTLPANLKTVDGYMFQDCTSLSEVNFNTGVTTITENAFYNCGLTTLTLPENITSLSEGAFGRSANLKTVVLPETFTELGNEVFYECNNLETINFPVSLKKIGNGAFYHCYALKDVTLPETIEDIQGLAFYGCSSLTSVKWPASVKTMARATFYECSSLREIILPPTMTAIGEMAFQSCSNLTAITLPEGITQLSESLFNYCTSLTDVTLPSSLTTICPTAFRSTGLKNILIPVNVQEVSTSAFLLSENLEKIEVAEGNNYLTAIEGILFDKEITTLLGFPYARTEEFVMPSTVTEIGATVFMNNTKLSGIRFSDNLKKIGEGAFQSCTGITEIKLPESLEEIGSTAFFFASNIQNIQLPNRDVVMGNNAFSATGVKSMIFPESITNIGVASEDDTFSVLTMNSALEWVSLPSTLTTFSPLGLYCNALKTMYCFAPVPPRTIGANAAPGTFVIKVPKGSAEAYAAAWADHYPNVTYEDVLPASPALELADNGATLKWEVYSDDDFAAPSRYTVKLTDATSTVVDTELTGDQISGSALSYPFTNLAAGEYNYELKGYVPTGQMTILYTGSFEVESSGITSVDASAAAVASTRYYDITGRELLHPAPGTVCIVRTVMTDGSVSVAKTVID